MKEELLKEMGFTIEQSETTFYVRDDFGDGLTGNTQVTLKFRGGVIYEALYSRGLGHFKNIPEAPEAPNTILNKDRHRHRVKHYKSRLADFIRLKEHFINPTYRQLMKFRKDRPEDFNTYESLVNEPLVKKRPLLDETYLKIDRSLVGKPRQLSTEDWYIGAIRKHESTIEKLEKYDDDVLAYEETLKTITSDSPVKIEELVESVFLDSTEYTFEEFCEGFGLDEDSRKAYKLWEQCSATHKRIEEFMSEALVQQTMEIINE